MHEEVRWRLTEARTYGLQALAAAQRFDYANDPIGMAAVAHLLEQVGEQFVEIHRGHEDFVAEHAQIPWREVEGLRHRMAHHYGRVDTEIVRTIIETDLPALLGEIEILLGPAAP